MINRILINNFKSIRELDISLDKINVLIGSNGAGKSNFISFFELIDNIFHKNLAGYTLEKGIDNLLYFGRDTSPSIGILLEFDKTNAPHFEILPTGPISDKGFLAYFDDFYNNNQDDSLSNITTTLSFKEKVLYCYTDWKYGNISTQTDEINLINSSRTWRNGFLQDHLSSFTVYQFHNTDSKSPLRRSCNINDNDALRSNGSNLAAILYKLKVTEPQSFALIEGTIRSIAPYFESFNLTPDAINPDNIRLVWKEKGSSMYLNGSHLSDGTIRFIALTTLLLQPSPPKVIIIDEPELGQHPTSLNKLSAMIKRASLKSQVILSTQSPNLASYFEPKDIITVDREDKQSVFKRLDSKELEHWLEDYSIGDLWEKHIIGGQP